MRNEFREVERLRGMKPSHAAAVADQRDRQTDGRTDGRTLDRFIDPARHSKRAVSNTRQVFNKIWQATTGFVHCSNQQSLISSLCTSLQVVKIV